MKANRTWLYLLALIASSLALGCGYDSHADYWRVSQKDGEQDSRLSRIERGRWIKMQEYIDGHPTATNVLMETLPPDETPDCQTQIDDLRREYEDDVSQLAERLERLEAAQRPAASH